MPATLDKPLGIRAYGHIPHLPGSRVGPGDHTCHDGQAEIATNRKRDKYDVVTVTVKLDGTCMAVARINDSIVALGRAGYPATTSPYLQHQLFAQWVDCNQKRFIDVLRNGERLVGEWLAQAHGTRYALQHEPFVPFDLMMDSRRLPFSEAMLRTQHAGLAAPYLISIGDSMSIESAIDAIRIPMHGEIDPVEGAVWRVERNGEFDFICKWVRPDKVDGLYLPQTTGKDPIWNWRENG